MRRLLAQKTGDEQLPPPAGETAAELRAELEKLLGSPEFKGSKRCRTFLRYVVEKTLAGQAAELKERTLAVELYGRAADADLEHDSAVRVCARHVRLRLERYYASAAAAGSKWRIELPAGNYVPSFIPAASEPAGECPEPPAGPRRRWLAAPVLLAAAAVAALVTWRSWPAPSGAFDRFWGPALAAPRTCILLAKPPAEEAGRGQPAALRAAAAAEIFHLFRSRNRAVQVLSMEEFSSGGFPGPRIVIGPPGHGDFPGLLEGAPFLVAPGSSPALQFMREEKEEWPALDQQEAPNSAVIYRIPGAQDRPLHVVFAGLSPAATLAAVRLCSDPEHLARLLREAPQEWDRRALAAVVQFPAGEHARFRLLTARLWQPRPPAP